MNRRKFFSFVATAPLGAAVAVKSAMDANGNDVAPLMRGDFGHITGNTYRLAGKIYHTNMRDWSVLQDRFYETSGTSFRSQS